MVCTFALFAESAETRTRRMNRRLGVGVPRREDVVQSMKPRSARLGGLEDSGIERFDKRGSVGEVYLERFI